VSELPHWPQIVANLCDEPYLFKPWEVGQLTPRQVATIYSRPMDDKGKRRPLPYPGPVDERAEALEFLQKVVGMPPAEAYRQVYGDMTNGD